MKITIDAKKCNTPEECNKCLNVCPTGVFFLSAQGKFSAKLEFQRSIKKVTYKLLARFKEHCNSCMECISVCPLKAITIQK